MRRVAFAIAGLVMIGAGPAIAQYAPRPVMPIGPMPPEGVFEMVRQMGLQPIGPPLRNGPVYIQRAADYYGKPLRVVVDASRAQVLSVEPIGGPPMLHGGPYASTGAPYWRRPYGPYGAMAPDDDDDYAPPGSVMAPRPQPPRAGMQPNLSGLPPHPGAQPNAQRPAAKSAAVTPGRPPVPRKRPPSAPQETAGSVEPLQSGPQQNAAPQAVAPAPTPPAPPKPPDPAMPPVTPLN